MLENHRDHACAANTSGSACRRSGPTRIGDGLLQTCGFFNGAERAAACSIACRRRRRPAPADRRRKLRPCWRTAAGPTAPPPAFHSALAPRCRGPDPRPDLDFVTSDERWDQTQAAPAEADLDRSFAASENTERRRDGGRPARRQLDAIPDARPNSPPRRVTSALTVPAVAAGRPR